MAYSALAESRAAPLSIKQQHGFVELPSRTKGIPDSAAGRLIGFQWPFEVYSHLI